MFGPTSVSRRRSRRVGLALLSLLAALTTVVLLWGGGVIREEPCLLLATVKDASGLAEGTPVFYRGLQAGRVVGVRAPSGQFAGWRLRMAIERSAFVHISADARVRVEVGRPGRSQVVVLPGLQPPDHDYPVNVKVLNEVSTEEEGVRLFRDVLGGLSELSRAKRSEAEVIELREEVQRLRRRLAELEAGRGARPRAQTGHSFSVPPKETQ